MILRDVFWTEVVNYLKVLCTCGREFSHRVDRWWVRCICGRSVHIDVVRGQKLPNEDNYKDYQVTILATEVPLHDIFEGLDPVRDVTIDESNLQGEFLEQSKLVAAYGYLFAVAEANESKLAYKLERLEAHLGKLMREDAARRECRLTEKEIEKTIPSNSTYKDIKLELIEAKKRRRLMKATLTALDHKLQALMSEGADRRKTANPQRILETEED